MTRHIRPSTAEALYAAIPVFETERFVMRGYRPEDLAPFTAFYGTERSRFVTGPLTPELAARALMTYAGHWHVRGYGRWMVEDRQTGEVLGNVGLWYPEGWPEPEIGWTLFEGAEGRGVAHETALAARAYAYDTPRLDHGDQPHRGGQHPLPRACGTAGRHAGRRLRP
jgi:RimJ/RimL family protein N-acetyltransferase